MQIAFELRGMMPLLMHADDVEAADLMGEWRKDPANKNVSVPGDDRSPPWTWQTYCYHDGEYLSMPAAAIAVCLRQAGTQLILKRQKTFKELTQSGMLIDQEYCEFRNGGKQIPVDLLHDIRELPFRQQADAVRQAGFRLFVKRAVIGRAKHVRVRPRFESWSVNGTATVTATELNIDVLRQIFSFAGRIGLCDWRPGCKTPGTFGMFSATVDKI